MFSSFFALSLAVHPSERFVKVSPVSVHIVVAVTIAANP